MLKQADINKLSHDELKLEYMRLWGAYEAQNELLTNETKIISKPKGEKREKGKKSSFRSTDVIKVYTDGSCLGNPGAGGWAAIIVNKGAKKELVGGSEDTTNNRMEIQAVISALLDIRTPSKIEVYTDSQYVTNTFNKHWIDNWQRNGWKSSTGDKVLNKDLWETLLTQINFHESVKFVWVKGHDGNSLNERCDKLAVNQAKLYQ